MNKVTNLKNTITPEDGDRILREYASGLGSATVARVLGFKTHTVERFVRDSGLMRERKVGAAMALREMAKRRGTR